VSESNNTTAQLDHWLIRLKAGDPDARAKLIEHAQRRLEVLARRMLHGFPKLKRWEETGDAFTAALARLFRSLADVQPDSMRDFLNLATIQIRRELLDLNKHYYGPEGVGSHHRSDPPDRHQDGPVGPILAAVPSRNELTAVLQVAENLPTEEQTVFDLIVIQGFTQKEAAEVLGVSDRTVRKRWHDVQIRLKDLLDPAGK
jgi:RNA polymerase sigma-70 factor (ECF subfamily)